MNNHYVTNNEISINNYQVSAIIKVLSYDHEQVILFSGKNLALPPFIFWEVINF